MFNYRIRRLTYENDNNNIWGGEVLMCFQDEGFLPSRPCFSTMSLITVVGVSKGMLLVRYFRSNKASFLCQSNLVEIIRLSQFFHETDHPQFWGCNWI